ncbi:Tn3 family transposase [Nonomuraea turcica]|uniref:Tn3 family transposase n=1 Tax=Nonomuraea sp. G32 TaxID=3067274 RepID=UPI0035303BE9
MLIELDARTHFLDCFTHAGGSKLTKTAETKRNILAVLIAMSTNLGASPACRRPAGCPTTCWPGRWSGMCGRRRCARPTR